MDDAGLNAPSPWAKSASPKEAMVELGGDSLDLGRPLLASIAGDGNEDGPQMQGLGHGHGLSPLDSQNRAELDSGSKALARGDSNVIGGGTGGASEPSVPAAFPLWRIRYMQYAL